jgi:hypothetical protein
MVVHVSADTTGQLMKELTWLVTIMTSSLPPQHYLYCIACKWWQLVGMGKNAVRQMDGENLCQNLLLIQLCFCICEELLSVVTEIEWTGLNLH